MSNWIGLPQDEGLQSRKGHGRTLHGYRSCVSHSGTPRFTARFRRRGQRRIEFCSGRGHPSPRTCWRLRSAADAIPLPKPKPRTVREHFVVPSIRRRDVACAEWPMSGASNISCSCSISSMMRSTSMGLNHLVESGNRSNGSRTFAFLRVSILVNVPGPATNTRCSCQRAQSTMWT